MFRLLTLSRLNIFWFAQKEKKNCGLRLACKSYYFSLSFDNRLSVLMLTTEKAFCNWYIICMCSFIWL